MTGPEKIRWSDLYTQALLGIFAIIVAVLLAIGLYYRKSQIGPEQPIPFSHRVHATEKQISCFMCHNHAMDSARSGVPPLETCMLCHHRIIVTYPQIQDLRRHYFQNVPVVWNKVTDLPEFCYFDHSVHIHRKIDCSHCHGNVAMMDRVVGQKFKMGFCIQCHRDNGATHDCFTCHR